MKHSMFTKVLAVVLTFALLIPGGALLASAACEHANWHWETIKEADCSTQEDGEEQKICDDCGETIATETILWTDAHDYSVKVVTKEPTCTEVGEAKYHCSKCDDVEPATYEVKPLGHNKVWQIAYEPTADHPGLKIEICTRCGEQFEAETFEQHEHECEREYPDDSAGTVTLIAPTCTQDGERGLLCKSCHAVFATEPIEATGHYSAQWTDYMMGEYPVESYIGFTNVVTTMPTCTKDGVITFLCDKCGEVVRSYPLDATGHYNYYLSDYYSDPDTELEDYIGKTNVVTTPATCTKDGEISFLCDECGTAIRTYPLEKTGHTFGYEQAVVDATCVTKGRMGSYCATCGELYETKEIEPLDHDYGEWTPNGDKTHSRSCSRCQFTDKATCKFNATVTPPTCTEGGYTTYVCTDCGFTFKDDFTDPLGHDWGAWTDDGDETHSRVCARCGEKETEAHCFGEWEYNHDAKFFKNGTKSMTCDVCGKVVTEKAQHTAWIWHVFYPLILWIGSIAHKGAFISSLGWFLPWLNIKPKI